MVSAATLTWGSCQLDSDPAKPDQEAPWPAACLKGRAGVDLGLRFQNTKEDVYATYAQFYGGFHLNRFLSLHTRFKRRRLAYLNASDSAILGDVKRADTLFLQIGNGALTNARLALGLIDLPFGMDVRPLPVIYDELYKTRTFWSGPRYGGRLTWQNGTDVMVDLGVTQEHNPWTRRVERNKDLKGEENVGFTFRAAVDLSALGGTRVVVSGYGDKRGERRAGAGMLNRSEDGAITSLEWVRTWQVAVGDRPSARRQVVRFNYAGPVEDDRGWLFEYEDDFRRYWLTTLGHDLNIEGYGLFRVGCSYYKARMIGEKSHWLLTSGLQVHL